MFKYVKKIIRIGGWRFGYEQHRIEIRGNKYQDRYMLCLGLEFRLHKFWRGDDERAPHDHPWWFLTFPFSDYVELIPRVEILAGRSNSTYRTYDKRVVRRFRFHYRKPEFQHIVVSRAHTIDRRPFWTFCIAGPKVRRWGFWPRYDRFIDAKDWN